MQCVKTYLFPAKPHKNCTIAQNSFVPGYGAFAEHIPGTSAQGGVAMDFYKVPIGFGMALAMNHPAMEAYAAMTEAQKQAVLIKAHNARSEKEMHNIVADLAGGTIQ